MHDLLHRHPPCFPPQHNLSYTLEQFLQKASSQHDAKWRLPIIVTITSSNNCGRAGKHILPKHSHLLLLNLDALTSIVAEYQRPQDGRARAHRLRLAPAGSKKPLTKLRGMQKLSKSLASLTTLGQTSSTNENEDVGTVQDDDMYNERRLVRRLNEKRAVSSQLCRIPVEYPGFFEVLDENNKSIEPCHRLSDLMIAEFDELEVGKHVDRWPHAFLLRSPCPAYARKVALDIATDAGSTDKASAVSNDSCYGSISDLDSPRNLVILDDDVQTLAPGQVLRIIGECCGIRRRTSTTEQPAVAPTSLSGSNLSPSARISSKSLRSLFKKRRQSQNFDAPPSESLLPVQSVPGKPEAYLKCRTHNGDVVYIAFHESGSFSPLSDQTHRLRSSTELTHNDMSGVFQLKDLLFNLRFPLHVQLVDTSISFDHNCSPATINPLDATPTKLRLEMRYEEQVVYACLLNASGAKVSRNSTAPLTVIPLSVDTDIEIQPCVNMPEIAASQAFAELLDRCRPIVHSYQTMFSLIHFPLRQPEQNHLPRQPLHKKRSQSDSQIDDFDKRSYYRLRKSTEELNYRGRQSDSSFQSSPLCYRDSGETIKQKLSSTDSPEPSSTVTHDNDYQDVDKIYDYIRSGEVTPDVQKIQAKEQALNPPYTVSPITKVSEPDFFCIHVTVSSAQRYYRNVSSASRSPAQMLTSHFRVTEHQPGQDVLLCKNDGNVDSDEAHALYLASLSRRQGSPQAALQSKLLASPKKKP